MSIYIRHLSHDQTVHYDANGKEVGLVAVSALVEHFRSHVAESSSIAEKTLVLAEVFTYSKVYYFDIHVLIKHNVLRFYVLVNYLLSVDVLQRLKNATNQKFQTFFHFFILELRSL